MIDFEKLSRFLRDKRKERRVSMEKTAEIVGISADALGKIERGECHVKLENVLKLLDVYDVPASVLSDFYTRSERMQTEMRIFQKHL